MKIIGAILSIALICSCGSRPDIKTGTELHANFSYRYDKNSGVTHIQLNAEIDSICLNALLDTGCPGLVVDKRIASKFPKLDSIRLSGGMTVEDVFYSYSKRKVRWKLFHDSIDVCFAGDTIRYDKFFVADLQKEYGVDVIINIPDSDTHIWYFDFENCRLDLKDGYKELICAENFDLTADVYYNDGYLCLKGFPFVFCGNNDVTLSECFDVLIDTGTYGISLAMIGDPENHEEEKSFFEDNSILHYEEITSTKTYHITDSGIVKDTLIISFITSDYGFDEVVAGLGLLSKFNIIFDLNERKAYLKKNTVEEDFYEYVQNHGASYSGIIMIPFKNDSAAVAIDVGRNMPTYKAGLRNYDIVTHLGDNQFTDSYASRYFYEHKDSLMRLEIKRFGEKKDIEFFWKFEHIPEGRNLLDNRDVQFMAVPDN